MIRLRVEPLPAKALQQLKRYQDAIDTLPDYAQRVAAAKEWFPKRQRSGKATFAVIRDTLQKMCPGTGRCVYCEDNMADEIDHFQPKDIYPELVFAWENFLYACGPCNGPKSNRYAVFSNATGWLMEISRQEGAPIIEPEVGDPVLINPRKENPLEFLFLDLWGTFEFKPLAEKRTVAYQRAEYTIEVLRLNKRPALLQIRKAAFQAYDALLHKYIHAKTDGDQDHLENLRAAVQNLGHTTVWEEIKRQRNSIPHLNALFEKAPEALSW
ncbi:MAG TPA: hypothetical protein VKU00_08630 [Chthonomonadaceae bacterium]|nr:hypothetical protein [Chthonomonadaceae bacterium]